MGNSTPSKSTMGNVPDNGNTTSINNGEQSSVEGEVSGAMSTVQVSTSAQIVAPHLALPLSMRLMKQVAGLCCVDCGKDGRGQSLMNGDDQDDEPDLSTLLNYDLRALHCMPIAGENGSSNNNRSNNSNHTKPLSASPLVLAPMTLPMVEEGAEGDDNGTPQSSSSSLPYIQRKLSSSSLSAPQLVEKIVSEYIAACRFYDCSLNPGVLTALRFSLPCLRVVGGFHDKDMLALAEILFRYVNGPLRYLKRLDFSLSGKHAPSRFSGQHTMKGLHSHGALTLAKVLQMSRYIEEVFLQRNRIGPYGASAIFIACATNSSIKRLNMRRCRVCERGALVFAELVVPSKTSALTEVDLSANYIGVRGSLAIEQALLNRLQEQAMQQRNESTVGDSPTQVATLPIPTMTVDLEGNHVLQEVMNAVTHGLGILLALLGTYLMTKRAGNGDHDYQHTLSCAVYSASLIVLYTSSTLYHSFFSMQNAKYIFEVFDKCAIYLLISGSYTPFLMIVLGHKPIWSIGLLAFIWSCCFLGIAVEASCPTWEYKGFFSLAMYLGMGWSALVCLPEISTLVPESCINIMVLGGVGYTAGVPFFVRNNNLDHAVWHLFVLSGSIFHWCGVYFFVVDFDLATATCSN